MWPDLLALACGRVTGEGCPFAEDDEVREEVVVEARPPMLVPEDSLGDIPSLESPPGVGRLGGGSGIGGALFADTDGPKITGNLKLVQ